METLTVPDVILSDYFCGDESEEFIFLKIPRRLITEPKFHLSAGNSDDTGWEHLYCFPDELCGGIVTTVNTGEGDTRSGKRAGYSENSDRP